MRNYAPNSPQALARIIGLTMLADGYLSQVENALLDQLKAHEQLGLSREAMGHVLQELCLDLLSTSHHNWNDALRMDRRTLYALLSEVTQPDLQAKVLSLCKSVAHADAQISDGEALILQAARDTWCTGQRRPAPSPNWAQSAPQTAHSHA